MILPTQTNRNYLQGIVDPTQPFLSSGAPEGQIGGSSPASVSPSPSVATQGLDSGVRQDNNNNLYTAGGGGSYQPGQSLTQGLLNPIQQGVAGSQKDIETLSSQFRTAAGPSRTYDSVGGQNALQKAIAPGASKDDFAAAKGLLGASYGGPAGFLDEDVSRVSQGFGGLQAQAQGLRSGSGLQAALTTSIPGLTPGQAAFEAQKLRYDPGFQREAEQNVRNVAQLNQTLQSEATGAQNFGTQRKTEESDIANLSREFLTGQKDQLAAQVKSQADAAIAADKAMQDQYLKIQQTGAIEDLPGEFQDPVAHSAGREQSAAAKTAFDAVMAEYDGQGPAAEYNLSAYGPLEKTMTHRGKEWYGIRDPETGKVKDIRKVKGLDKNTEHALVERQRKLEGLAGPDLGRKADKEATPYRDVMDLQFHEGNDVDFLEPGDFKSYVSFQPAAGLSVGNLATDDQIATFNQISDLLDQADELARDDLPFQAGKIAMEVDRYLSDEEAKLAERGQSLDAHEKQWHKRLRQMRSKYKASEGGVLGDISEGVFGSPELGAWGSRMGTAGTKGDIGGMMKGGIEAPGVGAHLAGAGVHSSIRNAKEAPGRGLDTAAETPKKRKKLQGTGAGA